MKKTERINLMMRYINNRAQFTIREIQQEFGISRATAIRDIQEIEALGFPLVTEKGRNGGYFVLQNEYLPAVRFTPDELRAIFISFLASKNSHLPYLQNRRNITEKLIGIANQTQQDELIDLGNFLLFENTNPANPNILELDDSAPKALNTLISQVVKSRYLSVKFDRFLGEIFVLKIINSASDWFVKFYSFVDKKFHLLPVKDLHDSQITDADNKLQEEAIFELERQANRASNVQISLNATAIKRFKRLHPPTIILQFTAIFQTQAVFHYQLDVNDEEILQDFADWLLFLGNGVKFDKIPTELTNVLQEKLENLRGKL